MAGEETTPGAESRTHLKELLAIGVVASVLGIALGLLIDWFPTQASEEAERVDTLWDVLIFASVPVFVLVMVVVLYSVWRYRMKPGEEEKDGPPIHGNTRLEIIWTTIPAIILVALCSYSYVVLTDIEDADAGALNVRVVGEQFTWTFYYRTRTAARTSPRPSSTCRAASRSSFTVQSKDVIHDFWVPGLPDEDRRGARRRHAPARHAQDHRAVPRGLRRAVRTRTLGHAPDRPRRRAGGVRQVAHRPRRHGRRAAARSRAAARPAAGAPRPTARPSSPTPAAAAATRWPTPARRAAPAPTSTRASRARTRPSSRRASWTRAPRSPRASRTG